MGKEFEVLVVMFKTKYKYNEWFENVGIQSDNIWLLETAKEKKCTIGIYSPDTDYVCSKRGTT